VTDDVIDGNAGGARIAAIAERGRNRTVFAGEFISQIVNIIGAYARHDIRRDKIQHLGGQAASSTHGCEIIRSMQLDSAFDVGLKLVLHHALIVP
jgi:hypothetical protein